MTVSTHPQVGARAALATLVSLEGMGPARLRALLRDQTPTEALEAVRRGRKPLPPPPGESNGRIGPITLERWQREARTKDPEVVLAAYEQGGYSVVMYREVGYPTRLLDTLEAPVLLSVNGDLDSMAPQTVAIVGTRRCTSAGADTAYSLGRHLAMAGVTVVSGLAAGIDAAAHWGALDGHGAAPIAVAGTGLDVVYPRENTRLWRAVAEAGAVVSEAPLGARPDRWRFPSRNRIIAALADVVVVVESPERGGSMLTVDEADLRGIDVMAVPGPVQSRPSDGTNLLLHEGRGTARNAEDVLLALGTIPATLRPPTVTAPPSRPPDAGSTTPLLEAFEWRAATADQLVLRTGIDLFSIWPLLEALVRDGKVIEHGGWYERVPDSRHPL